MVWYFVVRYGKRIVIRTHLKAVFDSFINRLSEVGEFTFEIVDGTRK